MKIISTVFKKIMKSYAIYFNRKKVENQLQIEMPTLNLVVIQNQAKVILISLIEKKLNSKKNSAII